MWRISWLFQQLFRQATSDIALKERMLKKTGEEMKMDCLNGSITFLHSLLKLQMKDQTVVIFLYNN